MSNLSVFDFEGYQVRFVGTPDSPEWVASDICQVLGIKNASDAVDRLEDYQKGIVTNDTPGGLQSVLTVKESGLYALIFTSRKQAAKRFQRWVFEEVLPSIRKTGSYISDRQEIARNQARIEGKYARRTLTDAIKAYVDRHPEMSDNARRWVYKHATDRMYQQTHGRQAKKLVEALGCEKGQLRDRLTRRELTTLHSVEDTATRLIDEMDMHPTDAIVEATERVLAVGRFMSLHLPAASSDRLQLLGEG